MKTQKRIAYAFPTSQSAKELGFGEVGCWFVQQTILDIEGSGQCSTFTAHNTEGFKDPDDPDLISLFGEFGGDVCPSFMAHGNKRALAAIEAARADAMKLKNVEITFRAHAEVYDESRGLVVHMSEDITEEQFNSFNGEVIFGRNQANGDKPIQASVEVEITEDELIELQNLIAGE